MERQTRSSFNVISVPGLVPKKEEDETSSPRGGFAVGSFTGGVRE
jgi:hypothetical protein